MFLLPQIKKYNFGTEFWLDLATAHYGTRAKHGTVKRHCNIVRREFAPPNWSELRPKEKYWALTKGHLLESTELVKDTKNYKKNEKPLLI